MVLDAGLNEYYNTVYITVFILLMTVSDNLNSFESLIFVTLKHDILTLDQYIYSRPDLVGSNYKKHKHRMEKFKLVTGWLNPEKPLPSRIPSPEFGSGPGLLPALTVPTAKPIYQRNHTHLQDIVSSVTIIYKT